MRGPVGTSVRLKIVHAGQDNPINVTVVRELVAGIGMEIAMQDDVLTVRASSAAAKAGLAAGDIITSVDDIPINGLNIAQLTAKFRGDTKSLRKAIATITETGADKCVAIVQGKLERGDTVSEAGLEVQLKTPKTTSSSAQNVLTSWTTGYRDDRVGLMAGVLQIADLWLRCPCRQPWAMCGRLRVGKSFFLFNERLQ